MDFKDFKDGLTSLSLIILFFSLTLLIGSIVLKSYIGLRAQERDFIVILCSINLIFSSYYLWNALRLKKIFKLENRNIIKFGKVMGVVTIFYIPHIFLLTSLFLRELHNLEMMMIFLIFLMELILIGLVLKEVYDLIFLEESKRDFRLEVNRKMYIEREKVSIPNEDQ
ncbi:MAG: hypothetical protein JSV23_04995 [Promethearchaeota archaeon]|nr:MAG: hypothetical protein JSV23_04995 [Candidatus Lokiarchaeota archaeon]